MTAWLPTIVTGPPPIRRRALAALRSGPPPGAADRPFAAPLGLHLEGPFLAPERRGAHRPEHLAPPDPAVVEAEGWDDGVALVTLAPELPGALDLVRVLVGGAASSCPPATASPRPRRPRAAVDAGVRMVTHLFNAMAPLHHREPGLAGVALTDDRVRAGIIADGIHVDPTVVALAAHALGDRLDPGHRRGRPRWGPPADRSAWAASEAEAAATGSAWPTARSPAATWRWTEAVRNLVAYAGVPLPAAVAAATAAPAAVLGLTDRGTLALGAVGDLVLLDDAGASRRSSAAGWRTAGRPRGGRDRRRPRRGRHPGRRRRRRRWSPPAPRRCWASPPAARRCPSTPTWPAAARRGR